MSRPTPKLPVEGDSVCLQEWERNLVDAAVDRVKRKINAEHYQIFHPFLVKGHSRTKVANLLKLSTARIHLAEHRVARPVHKEIQLLR